METSKSLRAPTRVRKSQRMAFVLSSELRSLWRERVQWGFCMEVGLYAGS